MMAFKCVLCYM